MVERAYARTDRDDILGCDANRTHSEIPTGPRAFFLKTTWPHHEPENLARMVWGKAQEYSDYLAEMCDTRHAEWTSILRPVGAAVRPRVLASVIKLAHLLHADYDRRILARILGFPAKMLWFAYQDKGSPTCTLPS